MANLVNLQLVTLKAACLMGPILLLSCAAPKIDLAVVQPPTISDALKLKRIAIGDFDGDPNAASIFARDVENMLSLVRIQGKPYFDIIAQQETTSAIGSKKHRKHINPSDIARKVGNTLNVDGIFLGNIIRSDFIDNPFQESRSKCTYSRTQYNKKGKPIGEVCVSWTKFKVNCIQRNAMFEFSPRVLETTSGRSIFSETLKASTSDSGCSDSQRPITDGLSLLSQAREDVLSQIRTALAPTENRVAAEIIESDNSWLSSLFDANENGKMHSESSEAKFTSGLEFAKAGRMDRACEIWKGLEPIESEYTPLFYNIGLCEESSGNREKARDYFIRADKMSLRPDNRITTALSRIDNQIQSQQILAKARPDIFYRSTQLRTADEDRKLYGYPASHSIEVKIRSATAVPEIVKAGEILKIAMDYSVIAPKNKAKVEVKETIVLKKNGKVLKILVKDSLSRPLGGSVSEVDYKTSEKMPPGTYFIEQKVQAGSSRETRQVVFVVS